jgi:hypothetical protein
MQRSRTILPFPRPQTLLILCFAGSVIDVVAFSPPLATVPSRLGDGRPNMGYGVVFSVRGLLELAVSGDLVVEFSSHGLDTKGIGAVLRAHDMLLVSPVILLARHLGGGGSSLSFGLFSAISASRQVRIVHGVLIVSVVDDLGVAFRSHVLDIDGGGLRL